MRSHGRPGEPQWERATNTSQVATAGYVPAGPTSCPTPRYAVQVHLQGPASGHFRRWLFFSLGRQFPG